MYNYLIVFYDYVKIFKNYIYQRFIQEKHSSNVEQIDDKHFIVNYKINNKNYKMIVKIKKGPNNIYTVLKDDGDEITNKILPYLGPNHDWSHNINPHTYFFPNEKITINYTNGKTIYIHL